MNIHPWNRPLWDMLLREWRRLPHALLLHGPRGVGRADLAVALARHRLCGGDDGDGDGAAVAGGGLFGDGGGDAAAADGATATAAGDGADLFDAATHPDFHLLTTDAAAADAGEDSLFARYAARYLEERKTPAPKSGPRAVVTVAAVRALIDGLATRPGVAQWRAVVVAPAEAMNANAANALLKVLEEPPPETLFVLTAANLSRVPATVRSRCMLLPVPPPSPPVAQAWLVEEAGVTAAEAVALLSLAGGAPLQAVVLHRSGFADFYGQLQDDVARLLAGRGGGRDFAGAWLAQGVPAVVAALQHIVAARIRTDVAAPGVAGLFALADRLCQMRRVYDSVLDPQLLLEELEMAVEAAGRGAGGVKVNTLESV